MAHWHHRARIGGTLRALLPLAGLSAIVPMMVQAQDSSTTYSPDTIAILPGYSMPSKAYGTTGTGVTVSGIYGHQFTPRFSCEVNLQSSTFETGTKGGTDFYENGGTLDVTYAFMDRDQEHLVTPFALVGLGAVYDDFFPNSHDGVAFLAEAGIGAVSKPLFAHKIRLRVDARYAHDSHEGGHTEGRLLAGIEIPLGRVEHRIEYLPGKVEIREIVHQAPPPPMDADGDGVDDDHDRCPNTLPGLKVDSVGCVVEQQTFDLRGVTFEFNKAQLTMNAATVLDLVSRAFTSQPSLTAEVAGHTDSRGSAAANQTLSQRRAAAVRDYMIQRGARPNQLTARGYGKSQLLISPDTDLRDQERNRRVELRVAAQ